MTSFRNFSIKNKIIAVILSTCLLITVLISGASFAFGWISMRRGMLHNISTLAQLVGSNSTAAIAFQDPDAAKDILGAFSVEPNVVSARIYTREGKILAAYERSEDPPSFSSNIKPEGGSADEKITHLFKSKNEAYRFSGNFLDFIKPIRLGDKVAGSVYIQASLESLHAMLKWNAAAIFASICIFISLAFLTAARLQRIISEPIVNLAGKIKTITNEKNYTVRAEKAGEDEVGVLVDGFNDILEQTQARELALKKQQKILEEQITMRTEELKNTEKQKKELLFQRKVLEAYTKIVTMLNSIDISEILENSLNEIVIQSESCFGAFYLCNEKDGTLSLKKSFSREVPGEKSFEDDWLIQAKNLAEQSFDCKQETNAGPGNVPEIEKTGGFATVAFPLGFQKKQLGVMVIGAHKPFSEGLLSFLKNTARQLGVAVHNALTFQELRHKTIELKQSNQELSRVSRMKSDFLANMSHELRTPLNHVIGFTEMVVDRHFGELNDAQEEFLSDALSSSRHLLSLINDVLDLSKVEAGKMELNTSPIHIAAMLENSLTMIKEKCMKHGIGLSLNFEDIPETIEADERKFKQIVFNLLSNAAKFTPDGGKIDVKAEVVRGRNVPHSAPDIFKDDLRLAMNPLYRSYLKVSISDTGIGIKPEAVKSIFEAFRQESNSTSGNYGGTGLGLSLCKQLLGLHKGGIWVESRPGEGSTFHFVLPFTGETAEQDMAVKAEASPKSSPRQKREKPLVLIIDDDEKIRRLMQHSLQKAGCIVESAGDGDAGVAKAIESKPDLIFLDLMLPEVDGWEVLVRLKTLDAVRDIPIVICSAIEDRRMAQTLEAFDYIVKPVVSDDLLRCLGKAKLLPHRGNGQNSILLVQENNLDRQINLEFLEKEGFVVKTTASGEEAVAAIAANAPALVFKDLISADLTAFGLIEKLRQNPKTQNVPVVILADRWLSPDKMEKLAKDFERFSRESSAANEPSFLNLNKLNMNSFMKSEIV